MHAFDVLRDPERCGSVVDALPDTIHEGVSTVDQGPDARRV